jgi:hypothetical protein
MALMALMLSGNFNPHARAGAINERRPSAQATQGFKGKL